MSHSEPGLARGRIAALAIAVSAMLAGCHSSSPDTVRPLDGLIGVYHFSERIPGVPGQPPVLFEGDFTVLGDTIKVDAEPGPCRYDKQSTGAGGLGYQCGEITLMFDRKNPVTKTRYTMAVMVPTKQQPQCSATVRRNCTTSTDMAADHIELRHGTITAFPVR
jgi:hypothetical protein